ncbi:ABC transporter [Candidatus Endobugula sertula]|uniref:ABC transporter n=1 Tax=Candidatus Endobugula sertula TaxID=62101 RepID=A0A1D2QTU1_9GAMM|nr:ABC transporter [Candidatus Endobugula sertula]
MNVDVDQPKGFHDPLLSCLLLITKLENTPCSETSLIAGLPLVDEKLTPELFVRASKRAGLNAKVVEKPLNNIPDIVLPATLILKRNRAVILLSYDLEQGKAQILESKTGIEKVVALDALAQAYAGYAIYTRPAYHLDDDVASEVHSINSNKDHWFWSVMRSSWRIYRDVLLSAFFISIFAVATPLFVMNVYDRVVPNNAIETLWVLAIGVLIVYVFDAILKGLRGYFIEVAGKKSDILLSSFLFERVLGSRYSERPASVGAFTSQFKEFDTVRNFYTTSTIAAFVDMPFVIVFIVLIFYIGGLLAVVPFISLLLILGYGLMMRGSIQHAVEQTFASGAQKNATLVESMVGLETVKTLGAEGAVQRLWEQSVGHLSHWSQKMRMYTLSVNIFSGTVQQVANVVIVILGVYLISEREMTMGALIASVMLTSRALAPIAQVAGLLVTYDQTKTALEALNSLVEKTQERDPKKPFIKRPSFSGSIQFKNVTFAYPGEEYNVLNDVAFAINPGERVGLIGRIGSGKSTIHKLILGLYKPDSGSILIDGIDSQQIDPADLRRHIGYMPQEVTLFAGSVKSNIMYGSPHVEDEDILRASELSGVKEFVDHHPLGFDRAVGERGQALSGGQRQSVGMARAMLHDVPMYLYDEPTSGMDNTTETIVTGRLAQAVKGKTLILVTHKASLLAMVDRLIVLDSGKIIADGAKGPVLEALQKGQLRVS